MAVSTRALVALGVAEAAALLVLDLYDAGGIAAERVIAVVASDLRVGRVLLAGDRDGIVTAD